MKIKNIFMGWVVVAGLIGLFSLQGCSGPQKDPAQVIQKLQQEMLQLGSGDLILNVDVNSEGYKDQLDLSSQIDVQFYKNTDEKTALQAHVALDGVIATEDHLIKGDLEASFKAIDKNLFIQLNRLNSKGKENSPLYTYLQEYQGKWLQIDDRFLSGVWSTSQKMNDAQRAALQMFLNQNNLFTFTKAHRPQFEQGHSTLHYSIALNPETFEKLIRTNAGLSDEPLSENDLKRDMKILGSLKDVEMWIGADDYRLYKAKGTLTREEASRPVDLSIDFTFYAKSYNQPVSIVAPGNSETLNLFQLLNSQTLNTGAGQ